MNNCWAIGDIHGCSQALEHLLEALRLKRGDTLITLGDYVNKGPDTKGVINRLIQLGQEYELISIRGNHDLELLEARNQDEKLARAMGKLKPETLDSYQKGNRQASINDIPAQHWDFLENYCRKAWETSAHIFVHGSLHPYLPLIAQPENYLYWERFDNAAPHYSGKKIICGHTSQKDGLVKNIGYAVCIDTWACGTGWLTALEMNSGVIWQANQKGKVQKLRLPETTPSLFRESLGAKKSHHQLPRLAEIAKH